MKRFPLTLQPMVRGDCCRYCSITTTRTTRTSSSTGTVFLRYGRALLSVGATHMRHNSTQFIGRDNATVASKGVKRPVVSSVKRMMPPPQRPSVSSSSMKSTLPPSPLAAANQPLFDVEGIITALSEVFIAYQKHLLSQTEITTTRAGAGAEGDKSGVKVPFYPPVPLKFIEEHFQSFLLRLFSINSGTNTGTPTIHLVGDDPSAEKNRERLASRIQSCGVFTLAPPPRIPQHGEKELCNKQDNLVLRVKPGVRELAFDIAVFLSSLESSTSDTKKGVPLAIIRRMSLSPSASAFIRHNLAGDVKRLLLVYEQDVFVLIKKGAMVRLKGTAFGGEEEEKKKEIVSNPSLTTTLSEQEQQQQQQNKKKSDMISSSKEGNMDSGNITSAATASLTPPFSHTTSHLIADEKDTVLHMGKRLIAPSAMERYRLSQKLLPLLDFIPVAESVPRTKRTITNEEKEEEGKAEYHISQESKNENGDDYLGFVDFAAVRDRAVETHPHLAPLLVLDPNDVVRCREGLLLSALGALGVEWRWGRPLPTVDERLRPQKQQQHQHRMNVNVSNNLSSEVGLLFLRRRALPRNTAMTLDQNKNKRECEHLLLVDLQVEQDGIPLTRRSDDWWKYKDGVLSSDAEITECKNSDEEKEQEEDIWNRTFSLIHTAVYDELTGPAAVMGAATAAVTLSTQESTPLTTSVIYPAGACADAVFVQHILRCFSTRHYEQLQSTLLNEIQGIVPQLFKQEILQSIGCLFFPYGRGNNNNNDNDIVNGEAANYNRNHEGKETGFVVFNKYVDGFYANNANMRLPLIRPRATPEEPPLAYRQLLPAMLVLEILSCLHREQQRHAEEIGLEIDDDDDDENDNDNNKGDNYKSSNHSNDDCLCFSSLRQTLRPASRAYIRDNMGDPAMIPLLISCFPQYFRVPIVNTVPLWSAIGLTREGRRLARMLENSSLSSSLPLPLPPPLGELHSTSYRSQHTGCCFTNDIQQQLDAFLIRR
ncbi:uncharacterized protein TM35_000351530 [Trypanosoma theileri]|uniref:Uncharacterized protein n=1 Tax=Trypanosoma theileri TaxID=67003 RepID=A0A1X0NMN6_9TRYP|nr:uncharacterized protein TM35_000351530 [Trypanosoma theileri]ORC85409.1 hypothetical protein TM35_000351530 [Trypanosoma theileri]